MIGIRLQKPWGRRITIGLATLALILSASLSRKGGTMADCCGGNLSALNSSNNLFEKMPQVDYEKVPVIGSPDASYIITLLFDYQCSQCQKIHFMLNEAIRYYKGRLGFALFPAPLNRECNPFINSNVDDFKNSCELARISLAVWLANREAFPAFDDWMFMFESGDSWQPRNPESARGKAVELVGLTKFDEAYSDPWIRQYIQTSTEIYGQTIQNGMGGIPKMIFGPAYVTPQPDNAEGLIRILQQNLAVPLP